MNRVVSVGIAPRNLQPEAGPGGYNLQPQTRQIETALNTRSATANPSTVTTNYTVQIQDTSLTVDATNFAGAILIITLPDPAIGQSAVTISRYIGDASGVIVEIVAGNGSAVNNSSEVSLVPGQGYTFTPYTPIGYSTPYEWVVTASSGTGQWSGTQLLYRDASVPAGNTIANTNALTAFASSYTIPAKALTTAMALQLKLYGNYSLYTASAGSILLEIYIGSVAVVTFGPFTFTGPLSTVGWTAECEMYPTSLGNTGTIEVQGTGEFLTGGVTGVVITNATSPYTIDTTSSQAVTAKWQFSTANAGNISQLRTMRLEVIQ